MMVVTANAQGRSSGEVTADAMKIANAIHTAIQRLLLTDRNYCDAGLESPISSDAGASFVDRLRMTVGDGSG